MTSWEFESDYNMEVLAFMNVLTGEEPFVGLYPAAYAHFSPRMGDRERKAVAGLRGLLLGKLGIVPSAAFLGLYDLLGYRSLQEMRAELDQPALLRQNHREVLADLYRRSFGGREIPVDLFDAVCRDLSLLIGFLEEHDFHGYWMEHGRPTIDAKAAELTVELVSVPMVPVVESLLGGSLESDTIRTKLVYFAEPYGMELSGAAQVEAADLDTATFLGNTAHELMHSHIDWVEDQEMARFAQLATSDPLFQLAFSRRRLADNYNSPGRLVEEDLTRALDQLASERLGCARDPLERWLTSDGGLHVLANALLRQFHADGYPARQSGGLRSYLAGLVVQGTVSDRFVGDAFRAAYGRSRPDGNLVRAVKRGTDPELASWSPEYRKVMAPGDFLVLIGDVFTATSPAQSLTVLETLAHELGTDLVLTSNSGKVVHARYLYPGNWSTSWLNTTLFYRNAFYFRIQDSDLPLFDPQETYRITGGNWKFPGSVAW